MRVRVPDDCLVVSRASLKALHDERDECRKQLEQALARIQELESRLAEQSQPPPNLFSPCYCPPGWVDPDTDPDVK